MMLKSTNTINISKVKTILVPLFEIKFDNMKYDFDILGKYITKETFNAIIDTLNKLTIEAFFKARQLKSSIYPSTIRILFSAVVLNIILIFIGGFEFISLVFILGINLLIIILIALISLTPITHMSKPDLYIKEIIDDKLKEINEKYRNQLIWKYNAFDKKIVITSV